MSHLCSICNGTFVSAWYLTKHVEQVHEKIRNFSCTVCPKAFARREHLKIHVKNVHEKVKDHICQICATSFGESSSLDRHVKSVHESRKCFKCTACPKVFFYKNSLKSKPIVSILSSKYSPVKFVTKNLVEKILLISTRKVFMKIWEMLNVNFIWKILSKHSNIEPRVFFNWVLVLI